MPGHLVNIRMEVRMRIMSNEARPVSKQLIELFICGLKCDKLFEF